MSDCACNPGNWCQPPQLDILFPQLIGATGPQGPLPTAAVPATSASAGIAGQIAADANYFYWCYATNSWARVAKSTWP